MALVWRRMLVLLAACGDNLAGQSVDAPRPPDAPTPSDGPPGLPDLTLLASQMDDTIVVSQQTFLADRCEVVEMCVGGTGSRRLLRFDTVTANIGTGDLVVGAPPAEGVDTPPFSWSPCHGHHHVTGYARYELLDADGAVISGHKQAFCLQDIQPARPGAPSRRFDCSFQGLSAGWADVYGRALPCQWIDVTDVVPGTYTLRIVVNPDATLPESDASNNEYRRIVTF